MSSSSAAVKIDPAERRTDARVRLEAHIHLHSESNFYTGFTDDISEGGVFVTSYLLEPIGTLVALELALPGGCEIIAKGVVRWVRDPRNEDDATRPGMGIEFESLDSETRAAIAEFVMNRSPDFHV